MGTKREHKIPLVSKMQQPCTRIWTKAPITLTSETEDQVFFKHNHLLFMLLCITYKLILYALRTRQNLSCDGIETFERKTNNFHCNICIVLNKNFINFFLFLM